MLGDSLAKYGRARCRMAGAQEEFGNRLGDGYMANLGMSLLLFHLELTLYVGACRLWRECD